MAGETSWRVSALCILLFVSALSALPATPEPEAELISDAGDTTLSTELKPPPLPDQEDHEYVLFVINLYGVDNSSGELSEETIENEVAEKVPGLGEPLATVLLLIEVDDDGAETDVPVDLDEVADDFEHGEGFHVDRVKDNGLTRVLRVKLDRSDIEGLAPPKSKMEKMTKVRNRRSPCLKCKLKGGGYNGGGGGGGKTQTVGVIPVVVIPVAAGYPSHYPTGGGSSCSTCGGGGHGGYGGGGGGNSYAQASAQASAGSQSWGK